MLHAEWTRYRLDFRFTAKTSREEMHHKDTYFVRITDSDSPGIAGIGECALFKGLSADDVPEFENELSRLCRDPYSGVPSMSAIRFGWETAVADLTNGGCRQIFPGRWSEGLSRISINGLIWMGSKEMMVSRVEEKLSCGFKILKLKVGGIDFDDEVSIIEAIRKRFPEDELELRLDANGNFNAANVMKRLDRLSSYGIHSIEQPVKAGQPELMRRVCADSPVRVALDEDLIGIRNNEEMRQLLEYIEPQYIILKPSLCGGFERADQWISTAESLGIGWWATSALESNIGLNAIAQWVSNKRINLAQGLGTGELYSNNIQSPVRMDRAALVYDQSKQWLIPELQWHQ